MPTYTLKRGRHFVSHITGPSHILLGLRFVEQPSQIRVVKLPPVGARPAEQLNEDKIRAAVEQAISEQDGSNPKTFIDEITFVEDDTPRYNHFYIAAQLLLRHYMSGGSFAESTESDA